MNFISLMGKKVGMTQVFSSDGKKMIAVTVILVTQNIVSQVKTIANDGYDAVQLAFEDCKETSLNSPQLNHLSKNKISAKRYLNESRGASGYSVGDSFTVDFFEEGQLVNVTAVSKGKGFAGVIKRHGQSTGPMSHGSGYHRGVGSMGSISANRVFKGKKLPGRMGNQKTTVLSLTVHQVLADENLILIRGSIPGPRKGLVSIAKRILTIKKL